MNIFDTIRMPLETPVRTHLVAMTPVFSKRSDMITHCLDAIPELFGSRANTIAATKMAKYYPDQEYIVINSKDWELLPV